MPAEGQRLIDQEQGARTRPMKVLVLGMCRTGTSSLQAALNQLGFNAYHMTTAIKNPRDLPLWQEALRAKYFGEGKPYGVAEFDKILGDFDAATDVPFSLFPDEVLAAYPTAKVILTARNPDSWLASMHATIFDIYWNWPLLRFLQRFDPILVGPLYTLVRLMFDCFSDGDRGERCRQAYIEHYDYIRKVVPAERLLEFGAPYEWEPLCEFLGVEAPEGPYPRANDAGHFVRLHKGLMMRAATMMVKTVGALVMPMVLAAGAGYFFRGTLVR